MQRTEVAILGTRYFRAIHIMESYQRFEPEAQIVEEYARKAEKAKTFAEK